MNSSNSELIDLPPTHYHRSQRSDAPPKPEFYGFDLTTPSRRWEEWVVKLEFNRLGESKHGNGFYINIPNKRFDVILTAGHNLVEAKETFCSNLRIVTATDEIPVPSSALHVCPRYFEDPNEANAIYDYGIILRERDPKAPLRGFGFNLMLGLAPPLKDGSMADNEPDVLQGRSLYVSGYRPQDSPSNGPPRRPEGSCVQTNSHQLVYKARTEEGMSGGPVWLGFRGVETVVGIHNYGGANDSEGNIGSRLNLSLLTTVCGFKDLDVGWTNTSLQYAGSPTYSMHLHLHFASAASPRNIAAEARVRVGKPGKVATLFDVLPVSALPNGKDSDANYGFILHGVDPRDWVRWDAKSNKVSLTDTFDARCEVQLLHVVVQPGRPFSIRTRLNKTEWREVQMGMAQLDEEDLEPLADSPESFEDTSEVSFGPISKKKLFVFKSKT